MNTVPTIRTIVNQYPWRFAQRVPVEPIHTNEHPFCSDPTCPCHGDADLIEEYLAAPHRAGLLTSEEGVRILTGRQV